MSDPSPGFVPRVGAGLDVKLSPLLRVGGEIEGAVTATGKQSDYAVHDPNERLAPPWPLFIAPRVGATLLLP